MMNTQKLESFAFELRSLFDKAKIYKGNNEYIHTDVYISWVNEYNGLLKKYNAQTKLGLSPMTCNQHDLSSTQKTVKESAVQYYIKMLDDLAEKIENDIEHIRAKAKERIMPSHQMRKCFKLGIDQCPINPPFQRGKVFIAMPFDNAYLDSYNYGIVPALNSLGLEHYKADNEINNKDIMCKICEELQTCSMVIVNISGLNPNVMLEHGLAYGLGKPVIIIKDRATKAISDIGSLEYIEYEHAHDLMQKLCEALQK